ncbi:MAG: DNA recombination protein RmuC [Patescibacteria group bacterium]
MVNPIYLLVGVVSAAGLAMLGINLYLTLSRRREKPDETAYLSIHQRLDAVTKLVSDQLEANRQSSVQASLAVHQQVQNFTQNMTQLHETIKQVHNSVQDVVSFQDIFKSPKLRGTWGESSLESVLGQYFPKDMLEMQHYFSSGEAVDAVLKLPNGLLLPIDSKFNWENFEKTVNADSEINKELYRKMFLADVKKKVDEISTKYLLPSEGTTDVALMYVPAETVYYEIITNVKEADIPSYARSKRVILVSPNTFYLTVTAVLHWFRDVEVTKQTRDIMKRLDRIVTDGGKLTEEFRVLGKHLGNASGAYGEAEKRLGLMVDRVKNVIELGEKEDSKKIEPPVA